MATSKEPIRIGLIQDWGTQCQFIKDHYDAVRLGFEDARREGVIDCEIDLVIREQEAYPKGDSRIVVDVWKEMERDKKMLAVIGPQVAQANVLLRDLVNEAKFAMVSHCATDLFYGEYCFILPNGFFPDEVQMLGTYLKKHGLKRVGVIYDDNDQGNESFHVLPQGIRRNGLEIVHAEKVLDPLVTDTASVKGYLERIRAAEPDVLVYLGNAYLLRALTPAVKEMGWNIPRVTTTTYIGMVNYFPEDAKWILDGWVGMDQYDERNTYMQGVLDRFAARFDGRRPASGYTAIGYDFARQVAEGIALAPELTRVGFKEGLEQVRMLPAAAGAEGNSSSYGRYDHRAYQGQFMVWRTMKDGVSTLVE